MAWLANAVAAKAADRKLWTRWQDALAVAVAVALPLSTSATIILIAAWFLAGFGKRDSGAAVVREALTPAGGLPVLVLVLGVVGVLWADVSWSERIDGLSSLYKFLAIPILLAQFRQSERGMQVLVGFLLSCILLLIVSWALVLLPNLSWRRVQVTGIPVKDHVSQGVTFALCAFGLLEGAFLAWRKARRSLAIALVLLAVAFLGNVLYVAPSRTALVIIPSLILVFGWLRMGWKGAAGALLAMIVLAGATLQASPGSRLRVTQVFEQLRDHRPEDNPTSAGERLEFWRKSLIFIAQAPVIGHGTGTIYELFRRSAVGQTGVAAEAAANPHNQIFAMAIQFGLVGTALLLAMWIAHLGLFRGSGLVAGIGLMVVVQNIVSSLFNSHLFDFTQGWTYVWGVGVLGGMKLRASIEGTKTNASGERSSDYEALESLASSPASPSRKY